MRPYIICHMLGSIDGGLHPSRYTTSPDGNRQTWSAMSEEVHFALAGDGWMVGRTTMAEMSKGYPHPPQNYPAVARPVHRAAIAKQYAVALDPSAKLHFTGNTISGDHVVVLLGADVPDSHLAELAADGISYIVSGTADMDIESLLGSLREHFGIERLLLEGGSITNANLMAAGLVDEFSLLIAPALDGEQRPETVVGRPGGLAGSISLSFKSAEILAHGMVHLRYQILPSCK